MEAHPALRVRGSPLLLTYSSITGNRTEMTTGKTMIEYQTFFTRLNILKSLAATIHAFESLIFVSSQVLDRYLPKLSQPH